MNMTGFFDQLRERKWALYVPERVYNVHRDGLLCGWSVPYPGRFCELLRSQGANLQLPFQQATLRQEHAEMYFIERNRANLAVYGGDNIQKLPTDVVADDSLWDSLVSRFDLTRSLTNRVLAWNGWVYRIRFTPAWVRSSVQSESMWMMKHRLEIATTPTEKEMRREWINKVQAKRRKLRREYGLTGEYFGRNYSRRPILMILRKAYPPDQVRRVRRQLEDSLRKDPAVAIRYALDRGLLK